ncbi:MAG: VIT family protein [Gammaproteobacteria bacterium]|nr:VIT family protein [Gammaproteobacteria bacterium]
MYRTHKERHKESHIGWLRAAVMGANDGIVSVASLIMGVAATNIDHSTVIITATAGLVAGAMSMAAGEYVSVKSQSDLQQADIKFEQHELKTNRQSELEELINIYINRGLDPKLAEQVGNQLMGKDALAAHVRDELGITEASSAQPLLAAFMSALTFSLGASLPVLSSILTPPRILTLVVSLTSVFALALLGGFSAFIGGASILKSITRVSFWGAFAMAVTSGVGILFGIA